MFFISFVFFVGVTSTAISPQPAFAAKKKFLVVIDPGHGGSDTGAVYVEHHRGKKDKLYTEKQMTLLLARDLARELIIRGHNVILTRNDDRLIPLSDRTALANRLKADVFISIHLNSSTEKKLGEGGVETFVLNHTTDDASKRLADLENAVLKESQAADAESSNVSLIMKDLILDGATVPSRELACAVQNRLIHAKDHYIRNRGVKQALFYVLLGADMPSILIEAGFMNSKVDRNRVLNTRSRLRMAARLALAIDDYRHKRTPTQCHIQSAEVFQRKDDPRRHSRL